MSTNYYSSSNSSQKRKAELQMETQTRITSMHKLYRTARVRAISIRVNIFTWHGKRPGHMNARSQPYLAWKESRPYEYKFTFLLGMETGKSPGHTNACSQSYLAWKATNTDITLCDIIHIYYLFSNLLNRIHRD